MNIEKARVDLAELDEKREAKAAELREVRAAAESEQRDLSDDETRSCDEGLEALDKMDADYENLRNAIEKEEQTDARLKPVMRVRDAVPSSDARYASARGSSKPEMIYRPNNDNGNSFFRDVAMCGRDPRVMERLGVHDAEMRDTPEFRAANTTGSTDGGGFVPPIWMGDFYSEYARASRPFADILPSIPLSQSGMVMTFPRITTPTAVGEQATENTATTTQAIVDSPLSVNVRTIAGYLDLSQQLVDRSDPGMDSIVFRDLRAAYDAKLDVNCLAGSNSSGQHLGIRAVSSINTVTYTDASPTGAELLPKLYGAASQIYSNRFMAPTHIVMHPRRSAWLASEGTSTPPILQQGQLFQGSGTQDAALTLTVAGLPLVIDANIATTYGAGTNEDEIYLVHAPDMYLAEGPVQVRVDPYTVGLNLTVRIVLYGYSAFASARFAKSITKISGTGLAAVSGF